MHTIILFSALMYKHLCSYSFMHVIHMKRLPIIKLYTYNVLFTVAYWIICPYVTNISLLLYSCAGSPPPTVIWLQDEIVVDNNYTETKDGQSYNTLEVPASRADLTSPFLCRASNNDLTSPDDATYTRNVTSTWCSWCIVHYFVANWYRLYERWYFVQ